MKRLLAAACLAGFLAACAPDPVHFELAGNPIITHMYSADPSAHVFGDSLYIYPSHDRDLAMGFDMEDYHCYVTADMQTFEDRGVIFRPFEQTAWAKTRAWAPDCVERNGKYYLYFPTDVKYIGVAVSDHPWGPFADPLGRPLLSIDDIVIVLFIVMQDKRAYSIDLLIPIHCIFYIVEKLVRVFCRPLIWPLILRYC